MNDEAKPVINRRYSHHPQSNNSSQRKKYRILSQRKRKSYPAALSISNTIDDEQQAEFYEKLGDKHFYFANNETASLYYSALLDRQFRKKFEAQQELDSNNNDAVFHENVNVGNKENRKWVEDYLDSKCIESNMKISVAPTDCGSYLQKAAVLFFQDKWTEARKILEDGLGKCTTKAPIKLTLNDLNKLEKLFDKVSIH